MPLPNFAHLQAQPSLLLTWLQTNLLISINPNNHGLGAQWLTIVPFVHPIFGATTAHDTQGNVMDVYEIRSAGANAGNGLRSFICNYAQGAVHQETLSVLGDFCFTAAMNGCTFGIGPTVGGQVTVAHANTGGQSGPQRVQLSGVFGGLGGGLKVLEPSAYRRVKPNSRLTATTFGVRTGMNWKFYFQSYESTGNGTYCSYGVMPV